MTTFVASLSRIGLDGAMMRFLPTYRALGERGLAAGVVRCAFAGSLGIGVVCALALYIGAPEIARVAFHSAAYTRPLREGAVLIPLTGMLGLIANAFMALKAVKWRVYVGQVLEPILTPTMLVIFYLFGLRLEALIFGCIVGTGVSVFVGWLVFRHHVGKVTRGASPVYDVRTWMRFGAAMLFGTLTNSTIQSTDVLGVGAFSTVGQVGLYRVADRVSALISLPVFAVGATFAPTIAELRARKDHQQLARMYAATTRWMFSVSLPVFLCCIIFARPILGVFGTGYAAGALALLILALGNLTNGSTGPCGNMVAMTSRVRVLWFNTALRLLLNVALIALLVPRYTLLGAAMASSLTLIVTNVVCLVEVWWLLRIHPYRWDMLKPVVAGGVATLVGVTLVGTTGHIVHATSGLRAFLYASSLCAVFVVIYALALLVMGLSTEDRAILAAARGRLLRGGNRMGALEGTEAR